MNQLRTCLSSLLLGVVACGPPGLEPVSDGDSSGTDSSADGSTSSTGTATTTPTSEPTTEGTGTEDTGTDESTDGSLTFVPFVEFGGCECDPFAQDCPDGEKCVAYASAGDSWDANKCVPVTGSMGPGEACSYGGMVEASDDCDADSACWRVQELDGAWTGVCHPFCMGTPDDPQCPPETTCMIAAEGSITLCVSACDPLAQDCGEGLGCYLVGVGAGSVFECVATSEDVPIGEPCESINDCQAGLICTDAESLPSCAGAACCTSFCDLSVGDVACEGLPGSSCMPIWMEAPPGQEKLGVCVSPA